MVRYSVAVGALALVLVTGCSSHGGPAPSPTRSDPATVSSPPTSPPRTGPLTTGPGVRPGQRPPLESDFAKQHDETGALAFASYFIRAVDWSIATNDTYLIQQISAPTCTACKRYVTGFATLRAKGESQRGGRLTAKSGKLVTGTFKFKSDYVFQFEFDQTASVVLRPSAPPSQATSHTSASTLVFVSWIQGRWQVVGQASP